MQYGDLHHRQLDWSVLPASALSGPNRMETTMAAKGLHRTKPPKGGAIDEFPARKEPETWRVAIVFLSHGQEIERFEAPVIDDFGVAEIFPVAVRHFKKNHPGILLADEHITFTIARLGDA